MKARPKWFERQRTLSAKEDPWCVCNGAYGHYDWSKGSKAVVASDGQHAIVLEYVGGPLNYWLCETGRLAPFDGLEAGLWVWEGGIASWRDYAGDYDEELDGTFRRLTVEEIDALRQDAWLWDDRDYLLCHPPEEED